MGRKNCLPLMVLSILVVGVVIATIPTGVESIGVCNGMLGNNLPSASNVVNMYQSNGINAMRLYAPHAETLNALKDSNIDVMMGVDDGMLASLAADASVAAKWIEDNIKPYPGVSFKYIVVGNEVPQVNFQYILPALSKMWDALCGAGYDDKIKISTAVFSGVLNNSYPPSHTEFNTTYNMGPIVQFLANTGNPLFANIYPYFGYKYSNGEINLDYALFNPSIPDPDGQYTYTNLFDAMVDSVYYALEKVGGSNVDVVVSESGWPSAEGDAATVQNAQTYNQNLINHVLSIGTPKRPGNLETYIFAMFNENEKKGDPTEKNFGLFKPDMTPVYPITFN